MVALDSGICDFIRNTCKSHGAASFGAIACRLPDLNFPVHPAHCSWPDDVCARFPGTLLCTLLFLPESFNPQRIMGWHLVILIPVTLSNSSSAQSYLLGIMLGNDLSNSTCCCRLQGKKGQEAPLAAGLQGQFRLGQIQSITMVKIPCMATTHDGSNATAGCYRGGWKCF